MGKSVRRLYQQFKPENYQLHIDIDKPGMKFSGKVIVTGRKTGRPSQRLTFHQKDLTIVSASLQKHDKNGTRDIAVDRINTHSSYDEVRLHAAEMLYPGQYTAVIEFTGTITRPMHGMYPCFFKHNGKDDYLLATQFESHHAREAFPCIDEPEAKATFNLSLTSPAKETVLSNMPLLSQEESASMQTSVFETSPIMSSYLLAWVIGDMHYVEATTRDGIIMRSYATVAQPKTSLQYANDEAVKILDFYTDYFHTPFPLPKLDQVALPDFESGAMENWGLITYREVALLADPVNRSQSSEQYVSMVIGHELSHQWFGNLVTMKWWDDLWLNESFASIMEHIALDKLHPDWFQWEQYTASDVILSSNRDIYKDVQSVRVAVHHPDQITTLFDPAIVYTKGGRLLKMLIDHIGEDAFRAGLKAYFKEFKYANTVRDDLWRHLGAASGKDINALMDPWLEQSGMPMLRVDHKKDEIHLSQKRFILDKPEDATLWPIPLLASSKLPIDTLTKQSDSVVRSGKETILFNTEGSGHMVVSYADESTREYVERAIITQTIPPQSRINVLNDYLLLARSGDASILEALEIVEQAGSEPRDAVWQQMSRVLGTVLGLTEGDKEMEAKLRSLRRQLAADWYKKLGWDDLPKDDPNTKGMRQTMLAYMVFGEDSAALMEAKKRYRSAKTADDLPAEQRGLIIGASVRSGEDIIDNLMQQYQSTPNPDTQGSIAAGLCSTRDAQVAKHIISKALGPDGFVRPQDTFRWYAYFMRNYHTREVAWTWMQDNWGWILEMFGKANSFDYWVVYSAGPINTPEWEKKFHQFFDPKMDIVALERNIKIAFSEITARVAWRTREEPKIQSYFKKS